MRSRRPRSVLIAPAPAVRRGAERILRAARRVFVRDGGGAFSARGVAKEAGVSLGAVQHFFRTKDELLAATLEHVLADFRREYERLQQELPFSAEARLLAVIDLLVADVWRPDSRKFFFGLHALSNTSAFVRQLMKDTYTHHQRRLALYMGAARPRLTEAECMDLALQIAALIDGLMIYAGPGFRSASKRNELSAAVRRTVLTLIGPP